MNQTIVIFYKHSYRPVIQHVYPYMVLRTTYDIRNNGKHQPALYQIQKRMYIYHKDKLMYVSYISYYKNKKYCT